MAQGTDTEQGGYESFAPIFAALGDQNRLLLVDRLSTDGPLSIARLTDGIDITRQAVTKHLRILEDAALITTRKEGREKRHFLNPVPIRLIHNRWIDKYTERRVSALIDLKQKLEKETS